MKKCFKKAVSSILATAMLFSSIAVAPTSVSAAASFSKVGGWNESIYAEISGVSDSDVSGVSYSGTMNGSLSGEDLEYLVRDDGSGVRIDIPGLKAGTYSLSVTTSQGTVTKDNIVVNEYDRSGYAHFNNTEGVGAYNDDGTLKDNAVVIYVTEDNKNTVSLTAGGVTVSGIGNILNSRGGIINTDKNGNVTSTVINTNQGILKLLASENKPLVVRIVGEVKAGDSNTSDNPPAINIDGLTSYGSFDYGGTDDDNGMMARIQNAKNITIEGVGTDASINGWGIHFMSGTDAYAAGLGRSCEIRNIYFQGYPEDAFGAEGIQSDSTLSAPVERVWVHNNNFGPGYCKTPTESDKAEGDGSCDFKRGQYYTMAYNKYWDCHKTNLIGSADTALQFHMSMHHNYYNNCMARGPLARQGNIHMYNNVYIGQTDYALNTRANAYIFSEYNLLYMSKNPMRVDSGAIKSYNDALSACIEADGSTKVTSRSQKVSSGCTYENFDTDSSISYIPSGDYVIQEDVSLAKKVVFAEAGVMKENIVTADEVDASIVTAGNQPSASVALPYNKALNSTYLVKGAQIVDNIKFNANKVAGDSISIGSTTDGQDIVFNVNQPVNISITDGGATYPVVLLNEYGVAVITGTGSATNVPAGTYVIQSSGFQPAKSGSPAKFKEAKITNLSISAYDENATTVAEPTTQATTEAVSEVTTRSEITTSGGDTPTEETTEAPPYTGEGLVWNYTDNNNTLGANVDANDWSGATAVSYGGTTLTSAVKMESSSNISFNAPGSGKLTLVTYSSKNPATVLVNGESVTVNQNGATTIDVSAGTVTITKGTASTYLYLLEFVGEGTSVSTTEATTETTTEATTVATTEATTKADTTTESTTSAPVEGVNIAVGTVNAKVGDTVTVPVKVTGMSSLATYTLNVAYDTTMLTATSVENGDIINSANTQLVYNIENGVVRITAINPDDTINASGTVLVNITFTAAKAGATNITLTVDELLEANNASVSYTTGNGGVIITENTDGSGNGDVNNDGKVNAEDAAIILKIVSGVITDTSVYDMNAADCDGKAGLSTLDAVWVLKNQSGTDVTSTTEVTSVVTTTEATTEATTVVTTTEATTEATTVVTTTEVTTTEVTTEAENTGSVYTHSFTDGKTSSYYTINGSLSTSKGSVTYNGSTISQCLKMESSTAITFNATKAGTLTLVFGGDTSAAGKTVKVDGTTYTADSNAIVTVDLASGNHTIAKGDAINLFYMSFAENGAVVVETTTQATTSSSVDTTTETTTKSSSTPVTGEVTLTTPPATKVATITSDNQSELTAAIKTVNSSGGTIYIDTPVIDLSSALKLSGSKAGAIVGVKQSDGTYPVLNFASLRDSGSTSRGITISGSNQLIQNVIVENSGDNGIWISGASNKIEHVIARYNGDSGIQLSDNADGNILKYCYAYRNCDIKTYGANADGFAPKLGATNTVFEYCYSWDNSDDGWDSYDKSGDNSAKVTYLHSACWNNGNTKTFTGEYDFNNGDALDTNLPTVQQIMAADSSFASNYAKGTFDTSNGKINGKTVSSWVSSAEGEMNGNGFKFGSADTAQNTSVIRTADYCVAFDHKSKGFDNNNSTGCTGNISNCVSFQNKINYQLPYVFATWTNNYSWGATSSEQAKQDEVLITPSDTTAVTNAVYAIRDQIVDAVYANKMPDGITFDSVIDSLS